MSNGGNSQFGSNSGFVPFSFGSQAPNFNRTPAYNSAIDFVNQQLLMMPRYQAGQPGLYGRTGSRMSFGGPPPETPTWQFPQVPRTSIPGLTPGVPPNWPPPPPPPPGGFPPGFGEPPPQSISDPAWVFGKGINNFTQV